MLNHCFSCGRRLPPARLTWPSRSVKSADKIKPAAAHGRNIVSPQRGGVACHQRVKPIKRRCFVYRAHATAQGHHRQKGCRWCSHCLSSRVFPAPLRICAARNYFRPCHSLPCLSRARIPKRPRIALQEPQGLRIGGSSGKPSAEHGNQRLRRQITHHQNIGEGIRGDVPQIHRIVDADIHRRRHANSPIDLGRHRAVNLFGHVRTPKIDLMNDASENAGRALVDAGGNRLSGDNREFSGAMQSTTRRSRQFGA
jgi:hypothetical protein